MFNVAYMYQFSQDGIDYEEIIYCWLDKEDIARLFSDMHLAFICVEGILYGRNEDWSWSNNYVGTIEEYITNINPYEPDWTFGDLNE